MNKLLPFLITLLFAVPALAAGPTTPNASRDLFFREALYHAYQGEWFDAVSRLDTGRKLFHGPDEPELNALYRQLGQAGFDVGDFELAYRMNQRAGHAITAIIEGKVEPIVRNDAIYRLAKIYYEKGQPANALQTLDRIQGETPETFADNLPLLRAQALMASGRFDEAVPLLEGLQNVRKLNGFAPYNLGIALIRDGKENEGRQWLDRAGQVKGNDPVTAAIRDKANLVLGEKLLDEQNFEAAKLILDRVRLSGPFSNRALLSSGWADAYRGRYDLALVPWSILAENDSTDPSVQEVMLVLPFSYGRFGLYSNAALMYGWAIETFNNEIGTLRASLKSIREGKLLQALEREELKQDANWLGKLRDLPESPETYYLLDLMESNAFQESLKNYLDLQELRQKLERWQGELQAYAQVIALRRAYYEPLMPEIDRTFRELDAQRRQLLRQRDRIAQRLKTMRVTPRPDDLTTTGERIIRERLSRLEQSVAAKGRAADTLTATRLKRLRGLLFWAQQTGYELRLNETNEHLLDLNQQIELLNRQHASFVRARQNATQSYQGYDGTIHLQQKRIEENLTRVQELLAAQGNKLEAMAADELTRRRERLDDLQAKARFAMADSYDRASRALESKGAQP